VAYTFLFIHCITIFFMIWYAGAQPTTSAFGNTGFAQPGFGGHRPGTRAAPYAETAEAEGGAQAGKLVSISAMPAYKDKSHEELRWEDYQLGDKGNLFVITLKISGHFYSHC
jgi:hypothetical protein